MVHKLYCYVDETGQDTLGKFFLVVIVLKELEHIQELEEQLKKIEKETKKNLLKWGKTPFKIRQAYLLQIANIKELKGSIFYSTYQNTKEYTPLISLSIAKAIFAKKPKNYQVSITIDGLTKKSIDQMRRELKKLTIHYSKIKGLKDEQNVFLRLADSIAGFLRDVKEGQDYTKPLFSKFKQKELLIEA